MRLCWISTEMLPVPPVRGGTLQTCIAELAPLVGRWAELTVFSVAAAGLPEEETVAGVRHLRLPAGSKPEYLDRVCRRLASGGCPDLIQVFHRPEFVTAVRQACPGARVVLTLHEDCVVGVSRTAGVAAADAVVTVSRFLRDLVAGRFPRCADKFRTIYSGADPERLLPWWAPEVQEARRAARKGLAGEGEQLILMVGRFVPEKGALVLARAFGRLAERYPGCRLAVVGSPRFGDDSETPYVREVRQEVAHLGERVIFAGFVPPAEIGRWYLAADLLACPSQWEEPLARVLYEAMAAGLPVVASDRGGNGEVIEDGVNGLLVRPHDQPEGFAEAIGRLLQDGGLRLRLGQEGRRRLEAFYTWERVARDFEALWRGRFSG